MTANIEVTRDAPGRQLPPIDPAVRVPDHVRRQTEAANAHFAAPATGTTAAAVVVDPPAAHVAAVDPPAAHTPAPPAIAAPAPAPATPARDDTLGDAAAERARYNSMKGRWEQSQHMVGSLQEQITQMGDELVRLQQVVRAPAAPQTAAKQPIVTEEDVNLYGPELIAMAQRAAQEALAPQLEELRKENEALKRGAARTAGLSVNQIVEREVPDWRAISADPRWQQWLRKPDLYSNAVRGQLLERAYRAADAPRVIAFYKGFLTEEAATGNREPAPAQTEQPDLAPRTAAVPLEALAAPGRARPASGGTQVPADKPIYTVQQISAFYANVRKGHYRGRETEKVADEQLIFAAQKEGRVRG